MPDRTPNVVPAPLALIPYAERFIEGRRVVILGDATAGLAEEAIERGARLVHVFDPDAARVAQAVATAERGVSYSVYRDGGEAGVRDGAFDVCLIPNLAMFLDARGLLAVVRRLSAAGAVVVAATPRVDGRRGDSFKGRGGPLNYYDFYDVLVRQFPAVKMVGQVPFQGFAMVDFSLEGDPEVSVDASLVDAGSREPVAYVAIASERRLSVEPYAIIQLPLEEEDDDQAAQLEARQLLDRQQAEARQQAESRQAEVRQQTEARQQSEARHQAESRQQSEARQQLEARLIDEQRRSAELSRALAEVSALPRQLEQKLTEEARRAEVLSGQLARAHEVAERLTRDARTQQERAQQGAKALADAQAERARLAQREEALNRRIQELEATPRGVDPTKVEALRKQLQDLERERTAALQQNAALQSQIAGLQTQVATHQAQAADLREQAATHQAQAAEFRAQVAALQPRVAALQAQITAQHAQLAQANHRMSELQAQAESAFARGQEEQGEQAADLQAAEATLRERAREIAALRHEVERRGGMVRELLLALETQGEASMGPTASLDRERLVHLEHELAATHAQIVQLTTATVRRESELSAAQSRVDELQRELATVRADAARAESTGAEAARAIEAIRAEAARLVEATRAEATQAIEAARAEATRAAEVARAAAQPAPADAHLAHDLAAARSEIDALRLALQQERAQRLALEQRDSDDRHDAVLDAQVDHEPNP